MWSGIGSGLGQAFGAINTANALKSAAPAATVSTETPIAGGAAAGYDDRLFNTYS